ncbi:MAG: hypothetical protein F6K28_04675 [Microcoleus sp. SIO2G3]|nr:hypothetical protein [Microcoleus sp. SIO2G3]
MTSLWEALVVGINRYPQPTTLDNLTVAAKDAEDIAVPLRNYGYQEFRVQFLPQKPDKEGDAQIYPEGMVKAEELQEALKNLLNPPPPNEPPETALFFFSGHGWRQSIDGKDELFLATSDAYPPEREYGLALSWLGEQLQQSRVKRVIVWLDCCFSGELMKFQPTNKAFCLITATRSYEPGLEIRHEQGVLTKTLLEGLNPKNYPDGIVTSHHLKDFIKRRMAQTSQRPLIENSQQTIVLTTSSPKRRLLNTCPYRSLSYFTQKPEDAEVFCGRSTLTQELIGRVEQGHRFVAVFGASGSGKSSLLRAGLLYQLKLGQEIPGSDRWIYLQPFTPQENPVESLKEAIAKGNREQGTGNGEELNSRLKPTLAMSQGIDSFANSLANAQPIVMVIDQFEEAFTMCQEDERNQFFEHLIQLNQQHQNLYIVIGMRSDFRSRLREYRPLTECINKSYINVEHLNREEIAEAIVKPADWVGLGMEGELKERIINDVEDYPGSLPLLQYTLTQLWNEAHKQGEQFLRLDTYEQLGGIEGTLEKRAEQVYQSLAEEERTVAQRLFLELTQVGDTLDIRRRVYLDDLVNSHHSREILNKVTTTLANEQNRLITRTEQSNEEKTTASLQSKIPNPKSKIQIDVVHEALIRHWKRLRNWQDENQEAMIVERDIETQAQQWQAAEKRNAPGMLLQGVKLAKAEDYLSKYGHLGMLDGVAEDYIKVSRQEDKNRRRRQQLTIGGVIGVVSLAAIVAAFFGLESSKQTTLASRREAEELAATAEALLSSQPVEAQVNAIAAIGLERSALAKLPNHSLSASVQGSLLDVIRVNKEQNRWQHTNGVNSVAFSPNGEKIVTGSNDQTVRLWDASTGKPIGQPLIGHTNGVNSVAFSPDGEKIVSSSDDKTVRLWDASTGKPIGQPLIGHTDRVLSVAFSPDGEKIVTGSNDQTVRLWYASTGEPIGQPLTGHTNGVSSVAFSPDGEKIATGSYDQTVRLWDATTGEPIGQPLIGHIDVVRSVAFSPNGEKIVTGSNDQTVRLWYASTGKPYNPFSLRKQPFKGHTSGISSVAFSPDGEKIVTGSNDQTVRLWDASTGEPIGQPLTGHTNGVSSVAFSPDGEKIVTGSSDQTVRLWDAREGKPIGEPLRGRHEFGVNSVAFSPNGKKIVSGSGDDRDSTVRLWDASTGEPIGQPLIGHTNGVSSVAFSPDGEKIVTGSNDQTVRLWDASTGEPIGQPLTGHTDGVNSVAFSPDGEKIVTGSDDQTVRLWYASTGESIGQPLTGHTDGVNSVAFSPDGEKIVTGSNDQTVRLWDASTGEPIGQPLRGHTNRVLSVAFSPNGKLLVSSSSDSTVRLWDASTREPIGQPLRGHINDWVYSVGFSPDGKLLVSGSGNSNVRLWDVSWESWLQTACNQLRDHPTLVEPTTNEAKEAKKTCQEYAWH